MNDKVLLSDLTVLASCKIRSLSFEQWAVQALNEFGGGVAPYLEKAWASAAKEKEAT